jgi:hypothetical protein
MLPGIPGRLRADPGQPPARRMGGTGPTARSVYSYAGVGGTGPTARSVYSYAGVGGMGRPARSASATARASAGRYSSP